MSCVDDVQAHIMYPCKLSINTSNDAEQEYIFLLHERMKDAARDIRSENETLRCL